MTSIVFDFDGTLVDSMPKLATAAEILIARNYNLTREEALSEYMSCVGLSFREQLDEIFPGDKRNLFVANEFKQRHRKVYETVQFHDGVAQELNLLEFFGIRYAVCSSSPGKAVKAVLDHLGAKPAYVTGRDHGSKSSQLFMYTQLGYEWLIGDAPRDGELARNTNFKFIGVEHTFPKNVFSRAGLDSEPDIHSAVSKILGDSFYIPVTLESTTQGDSNSTSLGG